MDFQENFATGSALKNHRKSLLSCLKGHLISVGFASQAAELDFLFHLQEFILQTGTESPRKREGEGVARATLGKQQRLRLSAGDGI